MDIMNVLETVSFCCTIETRCSVLHFEANLRDWPVLHFEVNLRDWRGADYENVTRRELQNTMSSSPSFLHRKPRLCS